MSRLGEFALRYAALRAGGTARIQAAKLAARDVLRQVALDAGRCPCGGSLYAAPGLRCVAQGRLAGKYRRCAKCGELYSGK